MNVDNAMQMEFLDCPAYLDAEGATTCGLPAEVMYRYSAASTDGPLESAKIRCPSGHWFNAPVEYLTAGTPRRTPTAPSRLAEAVTGGRTQASSPAA